MTARKVQCLFTYALSAREVCKNRTKGCPVAFVWAGVCGRTQPGPFPPVLSFPVHSTGVAGWAGNRSERIALQGVCPRLWVVLCRVCPWLPGALSTTAVQEKEKTLQRMKRKML